MTDMESNTQTALPAREAATNGLAVVGFIALITLGLLLAVYAARFVPGVVNGLGNAAVYLGSVFTPRSNNSSLSVVSTTTEPSAASTSVPFTIATSSPTSPLVTTPVKKPTTRYPSRTSAGAPSSGTYLIGGTATTTGVLSGLPDFVVVIDAVGYLATTSAESFVASSTVPHDSRPAVRFTIKNVGTNQTGQWRFSASIPTQTAFIFQSPLQQSLLPGDSIQYTLGFDQANPGAGQTISITANFDHTVAESNPDNDSASATLTILGS